MNDIVELARPEIRQLRPYQAAPYTDGLVRLNANETPWRPPGDDSTTGWNHYPEARPVTLTQRLADWYGVAPRQLLVTRGSSEAIDLLIRCFCRPGQDEIVICPPTFGMYEVYAQVQGAGTRAVPLQSDAFVLDVDAIADSWTEVSKLVFVCSPNNPTGNRVPTADITALARKLSGRGIVVVDAAYGEFADVDPTLTLLADHPNIIVLRTLSKALGLAGIRCGAVLAAQPVIDIIGCVLPPYGFSTPCQDAALAALAPGHRDAARARCETLRAERARVAQAVAAVPGVERVWPSEANFLLVRVSDAAAFLSTARDAGFLLRDFSRGRETRGCVRITIGAPDDNNRLLEALACQR